MIRLAIDNPSPVPPFFFVDELSACWNSSKILAWSASLMPGPESQTATVNDPFVTEALIGDLSRVGEFDGVADEVEQDLSNATLVTVSGGQMRGTSALNARRFSTASGSTAMITPSHDLLQRIVRKRQRELPGLDLRQVEHVVDEPEKVPAVGLNALEHLAHPLRGPHHRCGRE